MNTKGYWERIRRFCIAAVICNAVLSGCIPSEKEKTGAYIVDGGNVVLGKICIEGHVYFYSTGTAGTYYFPKLDDSGKPVKCDK